MIDFAETIEDCQLLDPGFNSAEYTWAKNGLFERLDRIFISEAWTSLFETTKITNLPRVFSDHELVLMKASLPSRRPKVRAFRFENMWARHPNFLELVRNDWTQPTESGGLYNLQIKLNRIKNTRRQWNKTEFGNIHANLKSAEEEIVL